MRSANLTAIRRQLKELADPETAAHSQRFFKTGPGEYGEGDQFIGIRVPVLRKLVKQHRDLTCPEMAALLQSKIHEHRLLALLLLVDRFQRGDQDARKQVYAAYLANMAYVNNWDLVDSSAHYIVGGYLQDRSRRPLLKWAKSKDLWERRIAIIATYVYIKQDEFDDTLKLAEMLRDDREDLIHKAVGWMLREIGNRDRETEERFLDKHAARMPRTMLRYAIERFPDAKRKRYLAM